ncbi:MAG: ATP-binding protein [Thermoproteota archaeon]|nr:ATP-binding protein [Thermoproteota archaeon]
MFPEKLDDWTYELIDELVDNNINETDTYDFKENIPSAITLTKICCAFANTKGGFVIVGIKEYNSGFKIEGIDKDKDLANEFGQKLQPASTIYFESPKIIEIPHSSKVLAVFHIPLSPGRPHIPAQIDRRIFYKRTNAGNEQMTYEEIRMSFHNYEERRKKLKLLHTELLLNSGLLGSMKVKNTSEMNPHSLVTMDSIIITSLLSDLYTIIEKNKQLLIILNIVRNEIRVINNKIRLFLSQMAFPRTDTKQLIKEHNNFLNHKADALVPVIGEALIILEKDFNLSPSL